MDLPEKSSQPTAQSDIAEVHLFSSRFSWQACRDETTADRQRLLGFFHLGEMVTKGCPGLFNNKKNPNRQKTKEQRTHAAGCHLLPLSSRLFHSPCTDGVHPLSALSRDRGPHCAGDEKWRCCEPGRPKRRLRG